MIGGVTILQLPNSPLQWKPAESRPLAKLGREVYDWRPTALIFAPLHSNYTRLPSTRNSAFWQPEYMQSGPGTFTDDRFDPGFPHAVRISHNSATCHQK